MWSVIPRQTGELESAYADRDRLGGPGGIASSIRRRTNPCAGAQQVPQPGNRRRAVDNLLAARLQMASSLAFHIIFAGLGIGLPLLMVVAEGLWLRTGNPAYLALARRWAKGTAILFAVGAVSGTVLSFELGLLWPRFMEFAGGDHRHALLARRVRLLHRGDLPRASTSTAGIASRPARTGWPASRSRSAACSRASSWSRPMPG